MPAQRFPTKEKAAIEIYGKSGHLVANVKNLSNTGACLELDQNGGALMKGDLLKLTVRLKNLRREHKVNAEVVWSDGKKMGIQFIKSNELVDKMISKGI